MPADLKLIGDEVSSACTAINRLREKGYDAHSRKDYEEALKCFREIRVQATNAIDALLIEQRS